MKAPVFALGILALALAGCAPETKPTAEPVAIPVEAVTPPNFETIALILSAPRIYYENRDIHVGQDVADAEALIPKPSRAIKFRDLPPGFEKGFRSDGWEYDGVGLGIITYNGKVAAAVHTETGVDEARFKTILSRYRTSTQQKPDVEGKIARYWFDTSGGIQRMICAVQTKDGVDVTEAVGTERAMKALRMNPLQAQNDVTKADKQPDPPPTPSS